MKSLVLLFLLFALGFGYDYYTFTQEVPGTVCKSKNCVKSMMENLGLNTLNIHGLWPDTADVSKRPSNCQANLYDESKLDPALKAKMDTTWVGLYNATFWFRWHEWGKHGTCWVDNSQSHSFLADSTEYFSDMNNYFQKVMDVKAKVNLESILYTEGKSEKTFSFDDLNSAILRHIGVQKYYIHCRTKNGIQYLESLEVCLDLNYNYVDCPENTVACTTSSDVVVPQLSAQDVTTLEII